MSLSANRELVHYVDQQLRSFQVAASAHIYKGALWGLDGNGYARPLVAQDTFLGIAYEEMDNSTGSDADKAVRAYTLGDFDHALSGAAVTNIGDAVFADDDDTLTFDSEGTSLVGSCVDVPSTGNVILRIKPFQAFP